MLLFLFLVAFVVVAVTCHDGADNTDNGVEL